MSQNTPMPSIVGSHVIILAHDGHHHQEGVVTCYNRTTDYPLTVESLDGEFLGYYRGNQLEWTEWKDNISQS